MKSVAGKAPPTPKWQADDLPVPALETRGQPSARELLPFPYGRRSPAEDGLDLLDS